MGNVSALEFVWVLINSITLVLTITALADARADREAVRLINGRARELAASGIVRRERLRVLKQLLLLTIAIPGLFYPDPPVVVRPDPIRIYPVVALMALSLLLLYQSFTDARERKRLTVLVTAEALEVKTDALNRIEQALETNTRISQEASDHADRAYHEANSVNEKIATQGAALVKQGEAMDADRERAAEALGTIDQTAEEVHDLHEGTAPS